MTLSVDAARISSSRGSARLAGRIAGVLYAGAGVFSLPALALPGSAGMDRPVVALIAVLAIAVGAFAFFAPWERWAWWSTLFLVPAAFALIAVSNTFSGYQPYSYSIYFVVVFVWLGISYPKWTSLWLSPLAILAYILPLTVLPGDFGTAAGSALLVIPACVLVGEVLAWGRSRLLRSDEDLRESRERTRGLADAAFEAIVLHEGDEIIEANPAFLELFGYRADELTGLRLSALGLNGADSPQETELHRKDGSTFSAEVTGRALPYEGKTVRVAAIRDVTVYRRAIEKEHAAAERLRNLDEMKNTFLNAVSHELRTPLAAVLGSALTLERLGLDLSDEDQRALLRAVSENSRKLERMLTDLLDLDRLTRGVLELRRQTVDLGGLVRRVAGGTAIRGHPLHLEVRPMAFSVDGPKVERIVENLVANAAKHTPTGCPIWVRVESVGEGALIVVEDAGDGVPEDIRSAIFEPFRQGKPRGDSPGVGIGLSLVSRFAELHDGRAWVEEREGGGSSFRVLLGGERPPDEPADPAVPSARIA